MKKFIFCLSTIVTLSVQICTAQCITGNCIDGSGVMYYPSSSSRYVGEFKGGKREGFGYLYLPDDGNYTGYWKNNRYEGEGIRLLGDGKVEQGIWREGQLLKPMANLNLRLDGNATRFKPGCISGNCFEGNGVKLYPDGMIFLGDFKNGVRNGYGKVYNPDKTIYEGRWVNDKMDGSGVFINDQGLKKSGVWKENAYVTTGGNQSTVPPGQTTKTPQRQTGCISGDCINGYGTYVYSDGSRYMGPFKDSLSHGQGVAIYQAKDGTTSRYEGMFERGSVQGRGTYTFADGRKKVGFWKDGKLVQTLESETANPTSQPSQPLGSGIKIWSVIIGVASYKDMPTLRFTDDDAYRIYAFLKSPEGGAVADEQIKLLIDEAATRNNILNAMREVFYKAGPNDFVLLYFSGHGLPGAFLPIDYNGTDNKIFHQEINDMLKKSPAKYKLCIADACHSGSMLTVRGVTTTTTTQSTIAGFYNQLAQAQAGTALIMSSKSEETSLEASGLRQGVFSHFLIRGLKGEADANHDKKVTIQELFDYVYNNVRSFTGNLQSPIIRGDYDHSMIISAIERP
jgi:hypothetical protein